jgi:hypothetical protein
MTTAQNLIMALFTVLCIVMIVCVPFTVLGDVTTKVQAVNTMLTSGVIMAFVLMIICLND